MKSNLPQARAASVPGLPELTPTSALRAAERLRRPGSSWFGWTNPVQEYWVDACQRWLLTLDALRQRDNNYLEQKSLISPAVLNFAFEVLMDGRTFERPVNYVLVRITPPAGATVDPRKRPFVIFDPRAGQGPGIGGMKHESEIGEVLQAGHPCYFVGFLENPSSRADHRGCLPRRGTFRRQGRGVAPGSGGQALFDRQLSGRLANHDDERHPTGSGRASPGRGCPAFILGGHAREGAHALHRRTTRRHLAYSALGRSQQWPVRWRPSGCQLREYASVEHLLEKALSPLFADRHGSSPVPRIREVVGQPGPAQCRGDAVDRR